MQDNPWLVALALAPLLLIRRSLSVPCSRRRPRRPKTGLFNTRHFTAVLNDELERARSQRPLSLLMADLDLLREINNSYGHLAGDAVLQGIAGVFRTELRHCDVPARFGGGVLRPPAGDVAVTRRSRWPNAYGAPSRRASSRSRRRRIRFARRSRSASPRSRTTAKRPGADPSGRRRRVRGEAPGPQPCGGRLRRAVTPDVSSH